MSFDGNGNYTVPPGTAGVTGTIIDSVKYNTLLNDLQVALSKALLRDGQSAAQANVPMGGFRFTGLAAGSANGDSVRFEQLTAASRQIQPVTATVAGDALTLGLSLTAIEFRNTPLTSGTVNARAVAAISLVVPSTATLGTLDATAARLVLLAIDNAGTVELAVANLAGGVNLDETALISTTAISAASDSASVVYSTVARTSLPFRVVGFIDSTQTVAGTWAAAPTRIQGSGGQALAAMSSIGYGQTWQNMTASRAIGTTYYNTTGKPISVSISAFNQSSLTHTLVVDGITVARNFNNAGNSTDNTLPAIVPAGSSYVLSVTGGPPVGFSTWAELR